MSVCTSAGVWFETKLDYVVEVVCRQCGRRMGKFSRVNKKINRGNRRLCEWM